jgi:ribose transport system permease protein
LSKPARRSLPAWATLAILMVWAGISVPGFLLPSHLLAIGQQFTPLLLVAVGQTLTLLVGGIDLSVGAVMTLSVVLASGIMQGQESMAFWGVLACLLAGSAVGLVNGLLTIRLRIPPFITTLATMSTVQGLSWVYTHGAAKGSVPESIRFIANGNWGSIPLADLLFIAAVVGIWCLLQQGVFGRNLYATGANPVAARLAGVPTDRVTVAAYVLSGLFAALGGVVLGGYVGVGSLDVGNPYVLDSIAAVIIGGTTFVGGQGGILGTAAGVWILAVLTALFIQVQIPIALRSILLSIILIAAALLHARQARR